MVSKVPAVVSETSTSLRRRQTPNTRFNVKRNPFSRLGTHRKNLVFFAIYFEDFLLPIIHHYESLLKIIIIIL